MPWKQTTPMEQRKEFVVLALKGEIPFRTLCGRFGISRKTGYKWLERYQQEGDGGLQNRSRKPGRSPRQTPADVEQAILDLRAEHERWGGRKLHHALLRQGLEGVPAASTCQAILKRNGKVDPQVSTQHTPWKSFVMERENQMWQMDHKGDLVCGRGTCFPLTVLDDHSRFNLLLEAHSDRRTATTQAALIRVFRQYGQPEAMIMDNGKPWGDSSGTPWTGFDVWLMRLGTHPLHSRPGHPQTLGKDERFHRTLKAEALQHFRADDLQTYQRQFDRFRHAYNHLRPHEALGMKCPADVYRPSPRPYPEQLPPLEYAPDVKVYTVKSSGCFQFKDENVYLSRAFAGLPIGLRPTPHDGLMDILFSRFHIASLDLTTIKITKKGGFQNSLIV